MILKRDAGLQRGILILPSAFTLANLFFGIYAVVMADRGDLVWAAWLIVFASITDNLDGRIARFTRTGTRFGAELDSLVDAVSFGAAPAFLIYKLYFFEGWGWIIPFVYVAAVVLRLARFNVEQGGTAHRHFLGMPSPMAGMLIATFYPFSQTRFFEVYLSALAWPQIMAVMVILVSVLMLSHVPYPVLPRIGFTSRRGIFNTVWMSGAIILAITVPRYYFFPAVMAYTCIGLFKSVILGLLDRLPERDPLLDDEDEALEPRSMDYADLSPGRSYDSVPPSERTEDPT